MLRSLRNRHKFKGRANIIIIGTIIGEANPMKSTEFNLVLRVKIKGRDYGLYLIATDLNI